MTLSDLDVRGVRVIRQLRTSPPAGVDVPFGQWDVMQADDRIAGEPIDYRLVAVPGVEMGDSFVDAAKRAFPNIPAESLGTFVERMSLMFMASVDGQDATPVELARKGPVVAKHRAVVLPDAGGDKFQTQVDTWACDLVVELVDGVERVVAKVRGETVALRRLQAFRDVTVDDWSPNLPGPVPVRVTYLLPPTHPAALLLARSTVRGMVLHRIPAETQLLPAFLPNVDRSPKSNREPRQAKWTTARALGAPPSARDAVDVTVELDPVSRDMTFGKRKGVRRGDVRLFLPFDARVGPVADIPKLVQECLQAMGDLPFAMSLDAMTAAAMERRERVVPADWRIIADARYGGTHAVGTNVKRMLQRHLEMMQRFGLHLRFGDQVKAAQLFLTAATDVPTGQVAAMTLNPLLFRHDQFGIGLPEGLLRLDAARHELTIRLGRYFAGRFSMTAQHRRTRSCDVQVGTMLVAAGIDLQARLRRDGRGGVARDIRDALRHLRDGIDAFPGRMLAGSDVDRRGDDVERWTVSVTASDLYLDALPSPRKQLPKTRRKRSKRASATA